MKQIASLLVIALVCASVAFAASPSPDVKPATTTKESSKFKAGGCCDKADKKGDKCQHPCCVKVAADGKVCEKCNAPAKK